jgi:polysaccharide biosynthesis/export protein
LLGCNCKLQCDFQPRTTEDFPMKLRATLLLTAVLAATLSAQEPRRPAPVGAGATTLDTPGNTTGDLPIARIGNDDLLGITVYDAPELTRTVRVDANGNIRLPMLQQPVKAAGLYPAGLESAIASALTEEHVLVDPVVTVTIAEFRSRPISVVGAVKNPITFQATGTVTLLDAIAQAGGFADNAGPEILVSQKAAADAADQTALVRRIPVHGLIDAVDPSLNLILQGGEEVRVPEAGKFYVLGNVKHAGAFTMSDGSQSTVLKALAMAEGLDHFSGNTAYIYRSDSSKSSRQEIPIELKKIMDRKSPDVPLLANDVLYVPEATGKKAALTTLDRASLIAGGVVSSLVYVYH